MDEYKKYLTDRVLSEEFPVTYRLLSRALNLHVDIAKKALYDFHKQQNASRANSVYATYLVSGLKPPSDIEMKSASDDEEGKAKRKPLKIITLVAEENLQGILDEYQQVDIIHVYSLAPRPQRDLALLSDVAKSIPEKTKKEDPAKGKKGGVSIPPPGATKSVKQEPKQVKQESKPAKQESTTTATKATQVAKVKQEAAETPSNDTTPSSSAGKKPAASLKRGGSNSIMQSFAKAAAKPPKPKPTVKKEEDAAMALSDDGEAEDSDLPPSIKKSSIDAEALAKTRKEREEGLRRMMEDYDKEEEKDDEEKDDEEKDEEAEDEEMEEAPEPEPELTKEEKPSEVLSSSSNGRRRGRRRVTKKKRILDDQGYMVTIQEEGWESFSEDEAPPPASKPTPASTPASSGSKAKKPVAKGSQGNIMSFFAKK
ncbi:hypothetical protein PT974_00496 [Cladobotryum mycophilum]|uniref:DNA polymerase delta subunit 3 n=1 Tax=Cladobotryum mycophilum TaxID=491253 RepID=A0ABR0T189_9HYPO